MVTVGEQSVDFDLHGVVAIRLLGATPRDVRVVRRQLGLPPCRLDRDVDVTIRFVDHLSIRGHVRAIGLRESGFTDDAFLVLRGKHKESARVQIPMETVGGRCEITCERGISAVPLLIAIVNFAALAHDYVPLHAAAFEFGDAGVIVTGWSKGGKTETLLSFMSKGARHVADEWCYVGPGGARLVGLPEPIRLWRWQLQQLPAVARRVPRADRLRLAALSAWPAINASLPHSVRKSGLGRLSGRVSGVVERQLNVQVAPSRLFPDSGTSKGLGLSHLLFVASAERPTIEIEPMEPAEVAARMVHSLCYERMRFLEQYRMFRFAFPERINPFVESAERREAELLYRAFEGKKAYRVEHPYPFEIAEMADRVGAVLS